jgi:hypothetical protein
MRNEDDRNKSLFWTEDLNNPLTKAPFSGTEKPMGR